MNQLSRHYLEDSVDGLPDEIKQYLDERYLRNLPNQDIAHPKLLVVFSGGNAVGKTTIAQKIQERFQALVIENDAIKRCLLEKYPDMQRAELNPLVWKYTMNLYAHLDEWAQNGLVVRDGVIDWYYDRILPVFRERGYEFFIIEFNISRAASIELIKKRGDTPTFRAERALEILGDHEVHQKRFRSEYQPDVMLTDDTVFDHDVVLTKLADKLISMS